MLSREEETPSHSLQLAGRQGYRLAGLPHHTTQGVRSLLFRQDTRREQMPQGILGSCGVERARRSVSPALSVPDTASMESHPLASTPTLA